MTNWGLERHSRVTVEQARTALPRFISRFLEPTHATLSIEDPQLQRNWSSRAHRKKRYRLYAPNGQRLRRAKGSLARLSRLLTDLEYWNVSWWVAQAFTWGSVVWVVNGFASFMPFVNDAFHENDASTGWTAFLGATIFELGSILGILEAWNRDDAVDFGWGVEQAIDHLHTEPAGADHKAKNGLNHHQLTERLTYGIAENGDTKPRKQWIWFSANPRYFRELGFHAAFWQLLGATIFWISGFTALPAIQAALEDNIPLKNGIFWTPQVIGGSGFMISSTFIMLEAQTKWWKPELLNVGWQVGVWNFIGAVGFTLCGALGYANNVHGLKYQSSLCTFWGGWAFLIGSLFQWYESVNAS